MFISLFPVPSSLFGYLCMLESLRANLSHQKYWTGTKAATTELWNKISTCTIGVSFDNLTFLKRESFFHLWMVLLSRKTFCLFVCFHQTLQIHHFCQLKYCCLPRLAITLTEKSLCLFRTASKQFFSFFFKLTEKIRVQSKPTKK